MPDFQWKLSPKNDFNDKYFRTKYSSSHVFVLLQNINITWNVTITITWRFWVTKLKNITLYTILLSSHDKKYMIAFIFYVSWERHSLTISYNYYLKEKWTVWIWILENNRHIWCGNFISILRFPIITITIIIIIISNIIIIIFVSLSSFLLNSFREFVSPRSNFLLLKILYR